MKVDKEKMLILMARKKINPNQVAENAGISVSTISSVMKRGACKPATAGQIAESLGVDVTEILEG